MNWISLVRRGCFGAMVAAAWLAGAGTAGAQGTRGDYERAHHWREITAGKVARINVDPHWLPDNVTFWYRNVLPGGAAEYILVDALHGTRQKAFDEEKLAAALSRALGHTVAADRLPLEQVDFGSRQMFFSSGGAWWRCDLDSYALTPAKEHREPSLPALDAPHPSRSSSDETALSFLNATAAAVRIYWIDEQDQRHLYATVEPAQRWEVSTFAGHVWVATDLHDHDLAAFEAARHTATAVIDGKVARPPAAEPARAADSDVSPDGRWQAFIKKQNVFVRLKKTGEEFALSTEGRPGDGYGGPFYWSPDSSKLVAMRTEAGDDRKVYLVESSPRDQVQPRLRTISYAKPGDRIALARPHLFDVAARKPIAVSTDLFANPWSIEDIRWWTDSSRFTFLYNQRGHQVMRIVAVAAGTGAARAIVDEPSKTFIDYEGKSFCEYLDATHEIIWMSERDGWNHLYLYDAQTGTVKNPITHGPWVVLGVERVDAEARQLWFRAGGIIPGQDPYYVHYCRVNFDGTGLVMLTAGDGTHRITYSPDKRFLVDVYSRVDLPPVTELRNTADGKLICELEHGDWTELLKTGWRAPERFVAKGRDGVTDIYGIICRPSTFDPAKKYPIVEDIYAGPQESNVQKAFQPRLRIQEIAELGLVVVQIDGMGTSNRSKAFHDVCWKNLVDAGFPDRILWIKAAAAKYPELDLTRVGIFGGSAGGQNALGALLTHGDFYKVAVADSGCHDNRMDKIWWNELWMGWPVGPHYAEQSNVTLAPRLQGKLLLLVGELDDNVDPSSTMQVVNALVKADKDFEMFYMPGAGHGVASTPYGKRRLEDFLVRNLLHVEPRAEP